MSSPVRLLTAATPTSPQHNRRDQSVVLQRGPVLKGTVSRTIRYMEQTQEVIRLVGLSATQSFSRSSGEILKTVEHKYTIQIVAVVKFNNLKKLTYITT
ncbi:hypothetical protein BC938DRAFT_475819, partial [Jimgerdemannia flammicorona]